METNNKCVVLIIGAGPSGLLLGYLLKNKNIDYLILEKHDRVGASWEQMPDHLHLISYWKSNYLIKEDLELFPPNMAHSAKEFAKYLQDFSLRHHLRVITGKDILSVVKENEQFVVQSRDDVYKASIVVDCRGYFSFPFIPTLKISGNPPLMIHFKDYKNSKVLEGYEKILVVGKRLSAGQLLCELAKKNNHKLFLSIRSELRFSPPLFFFKHFLRNLNFYEGITKKLNIKRKLARDVPMHIEAKKIINDHVSVLGDIVKIENKIVHFTCGTLQEIDAIIFATGFRPSVVNLRDDFESSTINGLFYLGRGTQRSFTSRFIRGIREDAVVLAQLILGKAAPKNKSQ